MFSSAPWTTLAVMLSIASAISLFLQPQDQIAAPVGGHPRFRRRDGRRVGLQDDRRTGDRRIKRQRAAPVEGCRKSAQLVPSPESAWRGLDQRRSKTAAL